MWIDLLKSEQFIKYKTHPERLREELISENPKQLVVIVEIQKVPQLLDEIHWLIENKKIVFALCGSSVRKLRNYYEILEDTLIGRMLPAYMRREKRRIVKASKFYMFDVGIVNALAKRGPIEPGSELFGKAFENWIFHELNCHRAYSGLYYDLSYWRLTTKLEVDFIVGDMDVAIEVKGTNRIRSDHLKGLRGVIEDHPAIKKRIVVCLEDNKRQTDDGILIVNYREFLKMLWNGDVIKSL